MTDVHRVMTCNEVSLADQIRRTDRLLTETQVGNGDTVGLLGVIGEVCLYEHIGVVADDLNGVLVCAYSTVAAKTPEFTAYCAFRTGIKACLVGQGQIGYVIVDTDCEQLLLCVLVNGFDLGRSRILGT